MSHITLRSYQAEAFEAIQSEFKNGINRQLIVLPTGSGKIVLIAAITKHFKKRILILVHPEELITQAADKILKFWPETNIGICKGKQNNIKNKIIIGSIQSCSQAKRLKQLKKEKFKILIVDEAHHAASNSYQKIIHTLGFDGTDKNKLLIGVTATPTRSDKKELGNTFEKIV